MSSREELLALAGSRFFTGRMTFCHPTDEQCQSIEGIDYLHYYNATTVKSVG